MNFMMFTELFLFLLLKWILFNQKFIKTAFFLVTEWIGSFIMIAQTTTLKSNRKMEIKIRKSKEHRPNPIIQMGLFTDGDGIPLAFSLFPGNQNEQKSLKPLETKILQQFGCDKFIYCSDAGLASEDNRVLNHMGQRAFIVTQSIKSCLLKTGHGL